MKELLEQNLVQLLDLVKQGGQFLIDEMPLVAQEIVAYGFYSNLTVAILTLLVCGASILGIVKLVKSEDDSGVVEISLFLGGVALIAFVVTVAFGFEALKAAIAPRLYLIESIKDLL